MSNLLSVNFRRAFLRKRFIIGGGFPLFIGAVMLYLAGKTDGHVDAMPFIIVGFLPILIGITGGLYISQDYTNNTIRNKIISGHSRVSIYFSNFITSMLGTIIIYGSYVLLTLGIGSVLVGVSAQFDLERTIKAILLYFCVLLTFTSITVMICMMTSGVSGTVFSCLMYEFLGMSSLLVYFIDYYLENKFILKVFFNVNPTFQLDTIQEYAMKLPYSVGSDVVDIVWIPVSSLIIVVFTTALGLRIFSKKDIK